MKKVLFLCTGNTCRSQMAEGLINHDFTGQVQAFSAGTNPGQLNPRAVEVMAELGIDISHQQPEPLEKYLGMDFDYVITLCGDAQANCPIFPGAKQQLHMGFEDPPKATGSEKEIHAIYRRVRDEIRQRVGDFLKSELAK